MHTCVSILSAHLTFILYDCKQEFVSIGYSLGLVIRDQKDGPREEPSTGLESAPEILGCWVVECGLEVGRADK